MHLFVGATLTATSVGLTARVLGDMGRTDSAEGRIILGAAVIDDVLGLVVLAVVTGLIRAAETGGAFSALDVAWILGKAVLFLAGSLVVGRWLSRAAFRVASRLQGEGLLLTVATARAARMLRSSLRRYALRVGSGVSIVILGPFTRGRIVLGSTLPATQQRRLHLR
jgi:Kef-type K+ transport system membrane component KefB